MQPDGEQARRDEPAEVRREAVFLQGGPGGEHYPLSQGDRKPPSQPDLAKGEEAQSKCYRDRADR